MKRLIISALLTVGIASGAMARHHHSTPAPLPASYQAVYCYPTGTYWQAQLSNPNNAAYYAANNALYLSLYGTGTIYCP